MKDGQPRDGCSDSDKLLTGGDGGSTTRLLGRLLGDVNQIHNKGFEIFTTLLLINFYWFWLNNTSYNFKSAYIRKWRIPGTDTVRWYRVPKRKCTV
jgi:hypothetical protein